MRALGYRAVRRYSVGYLVLAACIALAVAATVLAGPFILVDTVVTGSMWALIAVGLSLVFGVMNIPSFAQGEFFMIGTLVAYLVFTSLSAAVGAGGLGGAVAPLIAIGAGALAGAAAGALSDLSIFRPLRRRAQEQWVMNTFVVTIGLSLVLINGHQLLFGPDYKGIPGYWNGGITLFGTQIGTDRLVAVVIGLVTIAALAVMLKFSRFGRVIRAVAQDEVGARMVGINIDRVHLATFALSSALAALAGGTLLFMYPSFPYVGQSPLAICWTVVILAGLGSVGGAIASGFIVALLSTTTSYFLGSGWETVVPFLVILAILALRPSGLFSQDVRGVWER